MDSWVCEVVQNNFSSFQGVVSKEDGYGLPILFIITHSKYMFDYMVENVDGILLSQVMFTASWYAPRCAVLSLAATLERHRSPRGPEWYLPLPHGYLCLAISRELKPHTFHKKCPTASGDSCGYMHAGGLSRRSDFTWGKFQLNEWEFCLMSGLDLQYMKNMHPLLPLQPSAFGRCLEMASVNCCMFANPRLLMEDVTLQHLSMSEANSILLLYQENIFFHN